MHGLLAGFRRPSWSVASLAGYSLISFLAVGLAPLVHDGDNYIGHGYDPQIFIWAFAWWPHAIANGLNPFITHAVWSPDAVNLTWSTSVPGLALLFWPVTLLAGPIVSFEVACVAMPALAAWTAFLLCRYLTGGLWPSLVGGYLFGFSSYVLTAGAYGGHVNLSSVFLLPVAALVVLRFLDGKVGGRGLVVRLGPLLALQLLFSSEILFTLSLALGAAIILGFAVAPGRRRALGSLLRPLAGAYVLAGALTAPYLYYMLSAGFRGPFYAPGTYTTDLVNIVVPTKLAALGGSLFPGVAASFPGNPSEQGAYLGLPTLLILGLYARDRWRSPSCRFLLGSLTLALIAALGARAVVDGHRTVWLPWRLLQSLPGFDNVLTNRFNVYIALVVAVVVALWTARVEKQALRVILPALGVAAIVPIPASGSIVTGYHVPAFFTDRTYRSCLFPGETIVPFPFRSGNALLWQVEDGFRFNLVGGDLGPDIPKSYGAPAILPIMGDSPLGPDQVGVVRALLAGRPATSIVLDERKASLWSGALAQIATPQAVGGVLLYRLDTLARPCPGA